MCLRQSTEIFSYSSTPSIRSNVYIKVCFKIDYRSMYYMNYSFNFDDKINYQTSRWTKLVGSVKQAYGLGRAYCKKSERAMGVVMQLALRRDYAKKIDPCRMLVWLGRRTVPEDQVSTRCYLPGRYNRGRSCSNSNLLRPRVD